MNISIGWTLASLRKEKNLTQKALAEKLSDYGYEVNHRRIYDWEKEVSQPSIGQFLALCDILDTADVLWRFAGIHKGPYAGLNQAGREKARELIDLVFHIDKYRDDPEGYGEEPRLLPLYELPVSAGTGNPLDDNSYEMIEAPAYVPDSADFALKISGNSMEPLFQDRQIVWVMEQPNPDNGDIGIFVYDGNAYCKKLIIEDGQVYLRSINPKYDDIEVREYLGFQAIGKVVS